MISKVLNLLIKIIFLVVVYLDYSTWASSNNLTVSPQLITKIDHYIQNQIHQKKSVGCAIAIVDHGKIVFIKSYGVLKQGKKKPITVNTLFQLGSISKAITATLVAKLVKEKYLDLDLPIQTFVSPPLVPLTLRHILSHTTGYSRQEWNQKIEAGMTRDLLLKTLAQSPNGSNKNYDYHNLAFSLVEEIISTSMNNSFVAVMKSMLLEPLGMKNTTVGPMDFLNTQNFAWPHQKNEKGNFYVAKEYSTFYHKSVCSAGGINSTIQDMAIFLQLQLGSIPNFLLVNDLSQFHTPHVKAPDAIAWIKSSKPIHSYYGLGWRSLDYGQTRIVFHGGWLKGFTNFLGFIPQKKIGIVILNNSEGSFSQKVAFTFFDLLSIQ